MEQQVLRRITANAALGKNDQVRLHLITSAIGVGDDFFGIAGDIADREVKLGER